MLFRSTGAPEEPLPVTAPAPHAMPEGAASRESQLIAPTFVASAVELPSGLEQIESDPEKIRAVSGHAPEEEAERQPRRVRPTVPPVSEEPLVQVETGGASGADRPANAPH